jgi:hypothetical protein
MLYVSINFNAFGVFLPFFQLGQAVLKFDDINKWQQLVETKLVAQLVAQGATT